MITTEQQGRQPGRKGDSHKLLRFQPHGPKHLCPGVQINKGDASKLDGTRTRRYAVFFNRSFPFDQA